MQKSLVYLYTWSEHSKKEIKAKFPFTKLSKRKNYIGIKLTEETQHLFIALKKCWKKFKRFKKRFKNEYFIFMGW